MPGVGASACWIEGRQRRKFAAHEKPFLVPPLVPLFGSAARFPAGPRRSGSAAPQPLRQGLAGRRPDGDHRRLQQPRRERPQDLGRAGPLRSDVARGREHGHQGHLQQGRHLRRQAGPAGTYAFFVIPGKSELDGHPQQEGRSGRHRARLQGGAGSAARADASPRRRRSASGWPTWSPTSPTTRRRWTSSGRSCASRSRSPSPRRRRRWRTSRPPSTAPGAPTPTPPATCWRTRRTTTPG